MTRISSDEFICNDFGERTTQTGEGVGDGSGDAYGDGIDDGSGYGFSHFATAVFNDEEPLDTNYFRHYYYYEYILDDVNL